MENLLLKEMPRMTPVESEYSLPVLRQHLSGAVSTFKNQDFAHVLLCMANEIAKLQEEIKELKKES